MYDDADAVVRLLFQQSSGKVDWRTNFNFLPKAVQVMVEESEDRMVRKTVWIHRGYLRAWKSAEAEVIRDLTLCMKENNCENIEVSGWSYGGGMSNIAVLDIWKVFFIKPSVITFGSPNVFASRKSLDSIKKMTGYVANYAHVNDIVGYVPTGYFTYLRILVGEGFGFFKLFNPKKWHCMYNDGSLY